MVAAVTVTVHAAQSLDGRLAFPKAAASFSTAEGIRAAHEARASHDAVLVGIETVRIDDPQLSVRFGRFANANDAVGSAPPDPLRVILASTLEVPPNARVLMSSPRRALVIGARGRCSLASSSSSSSLGADLEVVDATADGMVSLRGAIEVLASRYGVKKLLVEGGARTLTSFFREKLVHKVEIEIAMCLLGDPNISALGALGVSNMEHAPRLENIEVTRLGMNVLIRGDVAR